MATYDLQDVPSPYDLQDEHPLPGASPDLPNPKGFGLSDSSRMKMGFASPDVIQNGLAMAGFKNPQQNKAGEWVAQEPKTGAWLKDQNNFWPSSSANPPRAPGASTTQKALEYLGSAHPINWAESHLGAALPTAGMVLGGGAGEGLLSVPLAAGGAATGETARQKIGQALGVNSQDLQPAQIGKEAALAGASELGGKAVGAIPLPKAIGGNVEGALSALGDKLRGAVTTPLSYLAAPFAGVKSSSAKTLMEDPVGVAFANPLKAAGEASDALNAKNLELGKAVGEAKQTARESQGGLAYHSGEALNTIKSGADTAVHEGRITPEQASEIKDLAEKHLTSVVGATEEGPIIEPEAEFDQLNQGINKLSPGSGYVNQSSMKKFGYVPQGSDKYLAQLQQMRGQLRDLMMSGGTPELNALGKANDTFSSFKNDADLIRSLQNPATQESFVNNLGNPGKTAQMEAAKRQLPNDILEKIKNGIAKSDFTSGPGPNFLGSLRPVQHGVGGAALAIPGAASIPWNLLKQGKQIVPTSTWSLLHSQGGNQ